jgi:hypothetical protein
MLKQSAIKVIKKHAIGTNNNNKRQKTGMVPTANGADGYTSLHQSTGRDVRLNVAAQKKSNCELDAESKNIGKALLALEKRKQQCIKPLERRRQRQRQQQQQTIQQQQRIQQEQTIQQQENCQGAEQDQEHDAALQNTQGEIKEGDTTATADDPTLTNHSTTRTTTKLSRRRNRKRT